MLTQRERCVRALTRSYRVLNDVVALQPNLGVNVVELGPLDTRGSAAQ